MLLRHLHLGVLQPFVQLHLKKPWPEPLDSNQETFFRGTSSPSCGTSVTERKDSVHGIIWFLLYIYCKTPCLVPSLYSPSLTAATTAVTLGKSPYPLSNSGISTSTVRPISAGLNHLIDFSFIFLACSCCLLLAPVHCKRILLFHGHKEHCLLLFARESGVTNVSSVELNSAW